VAEALACGTPVASTSVGLVPELVEDGVNGLVFDGTAGRLAHGLQRFLTDETFEAGLRSRLPPDLARFERETVIAGLAEGLRAIAAEARSR